jgi:glycine dehydrogenase
MTLLHRVRPSSASRRNVFLVSDRTLPQTIDVLPARAEPLGIDLQVAPIDAGSLNDRVFGIMLAYPDESGLVAIWRRSSARRTTPVRW